MPKKKDYIFGNKSGDRIQIINILAATSIALVTVLLGLSTNLNNWMIVQLSISIPCFTTSSLAYSKLSYRNTTELVWWNLLGWWTFSIGYGLILNAMAILLYQNSHYFGYWFIGIVILLFIIYSVVDILLDKSRIKEKALKLFFYLAIIMFGFFIPVLCKFI